MISSEAKGKKESKTKIGYRNMPIGGVIEEAGNSSGYLTGEWKTEYPHLEKSKCVDCLLCYIYCPEKCISVSDGRIDKIDLRYCKGCGICGAECKKDAIEMVKQDT